MSPKVHRDEVLLVLLAKVEIPLDPESVAATYDIPLVEWKTTFEQLEDDGDIEHVEDGLYQLTSNGREKLRVRGSSKSSVTSLRPTRLDPDSTHESRLDQSRQ